MSDALARTQTVHRWVIADAGIVVMLCLGTVYSWTQNHGMTLTAWGVGGIVGPFIAAKVHDATGFFAGALLPVAIMLVATVIPFLVRKPAATWNA